MILSSRLELFLSILSFSDVRSCWSFAAHEGIEESVADPEDLVACGPGIAISETW